MDKQAIHQLHCTVQTVFILLVDCMPHHAKESEDEMMSWYEDITGEDYWRFARKYGENYEEDIDDCDDAIEPECGTWSV